MKNFYSKFNEKKFKYLTLLCCVIADALLIGYIYKGFTNKEEFQKIFDQAKLEVAKNMKLEANAVFPPSYAGELWQVMITTVVAILAMYALFHGIIYLSHYFNKKFAHNYVKFYAWSGGVLMNLFALIGITNIRARFFFIPGLLLLFVAFGMKYFPYQETKKMEE